MNSVAMRAAILRRGLLAPGLGMIALAVIIPVVSVFLFALRADGAWSLQNFEVVLTTEVYRTVLFNTFVIAVTVWLLTIAIAFPVSMHFSRSGRLSSSLFLATMTIVLSISLLVRTYAWQVILAYNGPINDAALALGLFESRRTLLFTKFSVVIAMVQFMVPYAVLILFSAMRRVDHDIVLAARTLGAGPWKAFRSAYWPQVGTGVLMASVLVFSVSTGFFVTPSVLGGTAEVMLGSQIHSDLVFNYTNGAGLAAAQGVILAFVLIVVTLTAFAIGGDGFLKAAEK